MATPEEQLLREKAEFCLTTGVQPSEYDNMTDDERAAFIEEANRQARKAARKG